VPGLSLAATFQPYINIPYKLGVQLTQYDATTRMNNGPADVIKAAVENARPQYREYWLAGARAQYKEGYKELYIAGGAPDDMQLELDADVYAVAQVALLPSAVVDAQVQSAMDDALKEYLKGFAEMVPPITPPRPTLNFGFGVKYNLPDIAVIGLDFQYANFEAKDDKQDILMEEGELNLAAGATVNAFKGMGITFGVDVAALNLSKTNSEILTLKFGETVKYSADPFEAGLTFLQCLQTGGTTAAPAADFPVLRLIGYVQYVLAGFIAPRLDFGFVRGYSPYEGSIAIERAFAFDPFGNGDPFNPKITMPSFGQDYNLDNFKQAGDALKADKFHKNDAMGLAIDPSITVFFARQAYLTLGYNLTIDISPDADKAKPSMFSMVFANFTVSF
jgi:hypothetical protein